MNGTYRAVIVNSSLVWPNGLAIDYQSRQLYWCDGKTGKVETSDLLGGNRRILLDLSGQGAMFLFDIALYRDVIYWSDWVNKAVFRYNLTSGNKTTEISGLTRPMRIVAFDKKRQGKIELVLILSLCQGIILPTSQNEHRSNNKLFGELIQCSIN